MRALLVLIISLLCIGCSSKEHIVMQAVDTYGWSKPVSVVYSNDNTESLRDIAVALRYNDKFKDDTLTVVLHTSLPDVYQCREQVLLRLKRDYHATAVTASEVAPYRNGCTLAQRGDYIFTITPCRAVKGIEAVGIEIRE